MLRGFGSVWSQVVRGSNCICCVFACECLILFFLPKNFCVGDLVKILNSLGRNPKSMLSLLEGIQSSIRSSMWSYHNWKVVNRKVEWTRQHP